LNDTYIYVLRVTRQQHWKLRSVMTEVWDPPATTADQRRQRVPNRTEAIICNNSRTLNCWQGSFTPGYPAWMLANSSNKRAASGQLLL